MRACTAVLIFATVLIGSVIGQTGQEQGNILSNLNYLKKIKNFLIA